MKWAGAVRALGRKGWQMMARKSFFSRPSVAKSLRYVAAYLGFVLLALFGLAITWNLRKNVMEIGGLLHFHPQTLYVLSSWGSYAVFLPYVALVGLLEPYLNAGAKNGEVYRRLGKVLGIEAIVGVISLLISWGAAFLS